MDHATAPLLRHLAGAMALCGLLAACATGPGPTEQQANFLAARCQQGDRMACGQWNAMQPAVQAERSQQAQQNAIATGLIGAAAGAAVGAAVAAPRHPTRARCWSPYYRRHYWC